tara:strand:- start:5768 stop:6727 length:960 start_codon:yes stop_codon:yes gene_type:complete
MGYGIGGYLSLSKQSAFGTATTSRIYVPFVSESLTENKEQIQSENIAGKFDAPDSLEGINNVTGDIAFEPDPITLGNFMRAALGAPTSTLTTSSYVHEFLPAQTDFSADCALPPYTIEIYKTVGSAYQIVDAQIHTLTIEMNAGEVIKATASVHGRAYNKVAKTTPSYSTAPVQTWNQTSVQIAGAANGEFRTAVLTIENPLEPVMTLNASLNEGKVLRSGFRNITIAGDQDFSNQLQEGKFRAQTRQAFKFTVTGVQLGGAGQNNKLILDLPQVNYSTFAYPVGGPGLITASYEGKAEYFTTSSYVGRFTLQNTLASY